MVTLKFARPEFNITIMMLDADQCCMLQWGEGLGNFRLDNLFKLFDWKICIRRRVNAVPAFVESLHL